MEELQRRVTRALDHAEETGLPLLIELDDMNFMPEYSDPSMVEWAAFPKPGEKYGPRAKHYWLNWGDWMALPPPPNFESRVPAGSGQAPEGRGSAAVVRAPGP